MIESPRTKVFALVLSTLTALPLGAIAGDIPAKKVTEAGLYVTADEAAMMLADPSVTLVDVRTRAEVAFLGLPKRANVNIPMMVFTEFSEFDPEKGTYKLETNDFFGEEFVAYAEANGIGPNDPIILICRSGSRSAKAANKLTEIGFTQVYSMLDGYEGDKAADGPAAGQRVVNGWKNAGLDWSYHIDPTQLYPGDR
jgi:rhodanese-related sulfurtransferase